METKAKALCLLSGGLDSRLACKVIQEQCQVEAVHFNLPFGSGCCKSECAFNFTQLQDIKLNIIDCTKGVLFRKYLSIIRKPKHGYGSAINPCIDCHIFMLKEAKRIMKKTDTDFLVTGEVLNERPMSQHLKALNIVEKEAGAEGILLRPLSAKLLPETLPEKEGLIDRNKLLDINGRQRTRQIELASKFGIKYPSPGGGCKLCENEFAVKVRDLFKNEKIISAKDIELLSIGRHFRIGGTKIITGRNKEENEILQKLADNPDLILEVKNVNGPVTLIRKKGKLNTEAIKKAAEITARYCDSPDKKVNVEVKNKKRVKELEVEKITVEKTESLRIK